MKVLNNMADVSENFQITIKPEFKDCQSIVDYNSLDYRKSNMPLADIINEIKKYGYELNPNNYCIYIEDQTLYFSNKNNYTCVAISHIFEDSLPELFNWAVGNRNLESAQLLLKYFEVMRNFTRKYNSLPDEVRLQVEMLPINDIEDAA